MATLPDRGRAIRACILLVAPDAVGTGPIPQGFAELVLLRDAIRKDTIATALLTTLITAWISILIFTIDNTTFKQRSQDGDKATTTTKRIDKSWLTVEDVSYRLLTDNVIVIKVNSKLLDA